MYTADQSHGWYDSLRNVLKCFALLWFITTMSFWRICSMLLLHHFGISNTLHLDSYMLECNYLCFVALFPEEVGHGWTLLIKMAEVTLIDFSYLNRLAVWVYWGGPLFSNQDSRLGPIIEKAKSFLPCNIQDQLLMTKVVLISKGQPYLTSAVLFPVPRPSLVSCSGKVC